MPKIDWTRTAMPSIKSTTFSRRFQNLTLWTQESCKEAPLIQYGLFAFLGDARLTMIKSAFGLDIIQSTRLCQNKFGPRNSSLNPLLFENEFLFSFIIIISSH